MKTEKEKTGFFGRLAALVTRNWGLKLLSLILAVIVYHSLRSVGPGNSLEQHDRQLLQYN